MTIYFCISVVVLGIKYTYLAFHSILCYNIYTHWKILEPNVIILLLADLHRQIESYLSRYLSFLLYFGGLTFSFGVTSLQFEKSALSRFVECVCCCWILLIFLHETCVFPSFLKGIMFPGIVDWQVCGSLEMLFPCLLAPLTCDVKHLISAVIAPLDIIQIFWKLFSRFLCLVSAQK